LESVRDLLENRQAGVRRLDLTGAGNEVSVPPTEMTQPSAGHPAERLHWKAERGFGFDQPVKIQKIIRIEIDPQISGRQLNLLAPSLRAGSEPDIHVRFHDKGKRFQAPAARLESSGVKAALDDDVLLVLFHEEREPPELPLGILEGVGKPLDPLEPEPLFRDFRNPDQHEESLLTVCQ
jgi:hypothetical protein